MPKKHFENLPSVPCDVWDKIVDYILSLRLLMRAGKGWGHPEYEALYEESKQYTRSHNLLLGHINAAEATVGTKLA